MKIVSKILAHMRVNKSEFWEILIRMYIAMSKLVIIILVFGLMSACTKTKLDDSLPNAFFVFNNSLNKKDMEKIPYEDQAILLKKLGYDGIEFKETEGLLEAVDLFKKQNLKVYADYVRVDIDKDLPYLKEWKQVLPKLDGSDLLLWIHIHSEKFNPSDEAADSIIVPIVQELADLAQPYGIRLAIYPHLGFLAEKADDSFRLAAKVDRQNVGSVFNLCHFLKTDSVENLEKVIDVTLPKLFAVSISGADGGDTQNMDWDKLIQPLGKGTFNVYSVVELLLDKGYVGPIGLQCYNLQGQPEDYLKQSMEAWKSFYKKYTLSDNILTAEEKTEGWQLLFDGTTTTNWRGINKNSFPQSGWKIENGNLIADVHGGAESGDGGDIITEKKYSDFILKWDWNMKTKGGNSGVKYFVQEGLGDNQGYGFGLEYQLLDDRNFPWMFTGKMKPNDYRTLGALYEIYPAIPEKCPSPLGLWNESMLVSDGSHVEHWLNGMKVLEYERGNSDFNAKVAESKFKNIPGYGLSEEGHLLLQDHGSVVHFRNIKIKEITNL
jgi:sugar phosphate isomerase/epimerase